MAKIPTELLTGRTRKTTSFEYKIKMGGAERDVHFDFQPITEIEKKNVLALFYDLRARFFDGNWVDHEGKKRKDPDVLFDGKGNKIDLNREAVFSACQIQAIQAPEDPNDIYDAVEILRIMNAEDSPWPQIEKDAKPYYEGEEGWEKKDEKPKGSKS